MKVWILGIIAVVIVGGLGFWYWQSQQKTATTLPSGTVIYDVRTEDEFATDHISSAKFLPLTSIQSGTLPTEPKTRPSRCTAAAVTVAKLPPSYSVKQALPTLLTWVAKKPLHFNMDYQLQHRGNDGFITVRY